MFWEHLVYTILVVCTSVAAQSYWFKRPGTLYACAGDDVTFPWQYNPQIRDVSLIYWKFLNTGQTVIGHHLRPKDTVVTYHDTYRERASLMPRDEANAGILLKSVTSRDAGQYTVVLQESGLSDVAELKIIKNEDLLTYIRLDDDVTTSGSVVAKYGEKSVNVEVHTTSVINGSIMISLGDQPPKACIGRRTCEETFNLEPINDERTNTRQILTVSVYFGACKPQEHIIYIQTAPVEVGQTTASDTRTEGTVRGDDKDDTRRRGIIAAICISVILGALIIVALIVWTVFYRKKSKGYVLKPWQRNYVNLKIFTPLRKIRCKKRKRPKNGSGRRRSEQHKVPLSDGPQELNESMRNLSRANRSLTKEDITVVFEQKQDSLDGKNNPMEDENDDSFEGDESFQKDNDVSFNNDSDSASGSETDDDGSRDGDVTDPRVTSLQYSELDDSRGSRSRFV